MRSKTSDAKKRAIGEAEALPIIKTGASLANVVE
jgi:hypothetical protein